MCSKRVRLLSCRYLQSPYTSAQTRYNYSPLKARSLHHLTYFALENCSQACDTLSIAGFAGGTTARAAELSRISSLKIEDLLAL